MVVSEILGKAGDLIQSAIRALDLIVEGARFRRRNEPVAGSFKQCQIERSLQKCEMFADRGLTDMEMSRSAGNGTGFHDRLKCLDLTDIHHDPPPLRRIQA